MSHININFWVLFASAAIGGIATALVLPVVSYFFKRLLTRYLVSIEIERPIKNDMAKYIAFPIRIKNQSLVSLKNVVSFVTLSYAKEDMVIHDRIETYTVDTSNQPLMLSWAKVVNNSNLPSMDINQGESADLNLIRYHLNESLPLIQFASDQGFWNPGWNNKGRLLLKSHKDYYFELVVMADNMWPKRRKYKFDQMTAMVVET